MFEKARLRKDGCGRRIKEGRLAMHECYGRKYRKLRKVKEGRLKKEG